MPHFPLLRQTIPSLLHQLNQHHLHPLHGRGLGRVFSLSLISIMSLNYSSKKLMINTAQAGLALASNQSWNHTSWNACQKKFSNSKPIQLTMIWMKLQKHLWKSILVWGSKDLSMAATGGRLAWNTKWQTSGPSWEAWDALRWQSIPSRTRTKTSVWQRWMWKSLEGRKWITVRSIQKEKPLRVLRRKESHCFQKIRRGTMTWLWHWKWRTHSHTGGRKSLESPWLQTSRADGQLCSMRKRCLSYVYWGFIISSSFFSPLMVIKQLMGHC